MEPLLFVAVANLITYNLSALLSCFAHSVPSTCPLGPPSPKPPLRKTLPGFFQENPKCQIGLRKLNKAKHLSVSQPQELMASQWGGESTGLQEHHTSKMPKKLYDKMAYTSTALKMHFA